MCAGTAFTIHTRARSAFNRRCRTKRERIAQKAIQQSNETKWERLCYHRHRCSVDQRPKTNRRRSLGIELEILKTHDVCIPLNCAFNILFIQIVFISENEENEKKYCFVRLRSQVAAGRVCMRWMDLRCECMTHHRFAFIKIFFRFGMLKLKICARGAINGFSQHALGRLTHQRVHSTIALHTQIAWANNKWNCLTKHSHISFRRVNGKWKLVFHTHDDSRPTRSVLFSILIENEKLQYLSVLFYSNFEIDRAHEP